MIGPFLIGVVNLSRNQVKNFIWPSDEIVKKRLKYPCTISILVRILLVKVKNLYLSKLLTITIASLILVTFSTAL